MFMFLLMLMLLQCFLISGSYFYASSRPIDIARGIKLCFPVVHLFVRVWICTSVRASITDLPWTCSCWLVGVHDEWNVAQHCVAGWLCAAAVSALAKFGAQCEELLPSVLVLLERSVLPLVCTRFVMLHLHFIWSVVHTSYKYCNPGNESEFWFTFYCTFCGLLFEDWLSSVFVWVFPSIKNNNIRPNPSNVSPCRQDQLQLSHWSQSPCPFFIHWWNPDNFTSSSL